MEQADLALVRSMPARARHTYRIVRRVFAQAVGPLLSGLGIAVVRAAVSVGMALDPLLFPSLRRTRVRAPIVVAGLPRSGTTFLHRWLDRHGVGAGTRLWRMLVPSLTLGLVVRPLLPLLEKVSPARHHSADIHRTGLGMAETDDAALFFRFHDGFFLYGFFWAWDEADRMELFDPQHRDTSDRDFAWLEEVWRRVLVGEGADRVVAKLFSLSPRLDGFLRRFPDARVLFLMRDPLNVIPSAMSLVTGVLDARFGFWDRPEELRARYLERLYAALADLYLRFHADWTAGRVPRDNVMVVRFDRMMSDFEGVMAEVLAFVGHEPDAALEAAIRETAERQRAYRSRHRYDLARFGLTEERVRADLAPIYETFLS